MLILRAMCTSSCWVCWLNVLGQLFSIAGIILAVVGVRSLKLICFRVGRYLPAAFGFGSKPCFLDVVRVLLRSRARRPAWELWAPRTFQ
jgi:hypothetical protein